MVPVHFGPRIRERLTGGELIFGSHVFCGTPMLSEAIAIVGFDCVWIDMEHTAIDKRAVLDNIIAVHSGNAASLVRIPWNDPVLAKPILDMGPDAILFPYIRNRNDALLAVSSCVYPQSGIRGYGPLRALRYGKYSQQEYVGERYKDMLRMIQIEHIDIVNNLESIIEIEGIDAFIIGPNDLAASIGCLGKPTSPELMQIFDEVSRKLSAAKKPFGVSLAYEPETLKQWVNRGAQLLFAGNDSSYVYEGAKKVFYGMHNIEKESVR